ncbi:TrmB family transcriptional regulator [Streptomyces sp. NPDC050400]|uniref:TrmB family transcriptional regulator n=1 Tax=Streptomyces sp. NPDC050400 TaxID=3365610 RepID=UPI0037A2B212
MSGAPRPSSLGGIGLGAAEERLYQRLVTDGPLVPAVRGRIAARLVALGLAEYMDDGRLTATPPQITLAELVSAREVEVRRAREAAERLTAAYRARADRNPQDGHLDVVHGGERIGRLIRQVLRDARTEVRFFARPPFSVLDVRHPDDEETELGARGIRERLVIGRDVLDEPDAHSVIRASLDRGQEIRFAPQLPCKLLIADDETAVVQLDDGGPHHDGVLVVRRGGVLDALAALFEFQWEHAASLRESGDGRIEPRPEATGDLLDEEDRTLLALLLAGHTDASAAHRAGVGRRTVQRRIRRLMDLTGTDTRLQLGWYARDRGWL